MSDDHHESLDLFDDHEEVVSEDGKKVTRRGIYLLPNLLTTASLFSGFFSIVSAINGNFIASGMALFAAQMLDGLDGRVARLTNSQSLFGAQYDSLCDVISFGLAPAIIVFLWGLDSLGQTGWVFSFFYVAAAALRLARFNTFIGSEDTYFKGLPSPVASATVVYFVWAMSSFGIQGEEVGRILAIFTALLTGFVSLLMVVNIPYYSFKEIELKKRVPFFSMLFVVFIFVLISIDPPIVLASLAFAYIISGPLLWVKKRIKN
ncbi:CDP-diacylglycerol--serine O-phosphatidyltransferase [SAR86 cluster bacterium]|nr:CDP-diacylglycerol--serine O-phosphatidyltransferase [SAR86 cluster bacterium]